MIYEEPREVFIATVRGNAWIYMALTTRNTGYMHWEYEIHTDPDHKPPAHLPLISSPVWIEKEELWAKKSSEDRKQWLESRE